MCFENEKIISMNYNGNKIQELRKNYVKKFWCKPWLKINNIIVKL